MVACQRLNAGYASERKEERKPETAVGPSRLGVADENGSPATFGTRVGPIHDQREHLMDDDRMQDLIGEIQSIGGKLDDLLKETRLVKRALDSDPDGIRQIAHDIRWDLREVKVGIDNLR